ncbi:MAG: purine/pyrimidine permease [Victivallales bacterium]|nr:purine/pyrimidine permease [Victivallales bacterium]
MNGLTSEKEDWRLVAIGGTQQALAAFAGITMVPLIILRSIGGGAEECALCVSLAMLVSGISTLLQSLRLGFIGSGYLLVMGTSSMFIAPSIMAGKAGGVALIFGMVMLMSPVEFILAPLSRYLKRVATAPVVGCIVLLLAFSVLPVSMKQFIGGYAKDSGAWRHLLLGFITLACIAAAQVSPWRPLKAASIVVGLLVGYILGAAMGLCDFAQLADSAWFGTPRPFWYGLPKFSLEMMLPFGMAYFLTTIETYGDLHAIAHVNGEAVPEPKRVSGGLAADALGSLLAGATGTMANTTFSGNVAIAGMSGVKSPKCAYVVAGIFAVLSFMPKLAAAVSAMPSAVLGASMLVACVFLINVALQMIGKCDEGEKMVVAIGVAAGLGVQMLPELGDKAPAWLALFLKSSVSVGTVAAVLSSYIMRLLCNKQ